VIVQEGGDGSGWEKKEKMIDLEENISLRKLDETPACPSCRHGGGSRVLDRGEGSRIEMYASHLSCPRLCRGNGDETNAHAGNSHTREVRGPRARPALVRPSHSSPHIRPFQIPTRYPLGPLLIPRPMPPIPTKNTRLVLAERPARGPITDKTFRQESTPIPELKDGEILVRVDYVSIVRSPPPYPS